MVEQHQAPRHGRVLWGARLLEAHDQARVRLALEAYTYGHFPVVAGIVLAALGIEGVLAHAGDNKPLGAFYALPLFGGVALYLAGQLLFQAPYAQAAEPATAGGDRRAPGRRASRRRPPRLVGLAGLVLIVAALIVVETTRYAQTRRSLRGA